jgi:predicted peptidase
VLAAAFLAGPSPATAQAAETGFLNRTVRVDDVVYRYQVYVPAAYDSQARWPVLLFLHGAGERGDDGLLQTEVGLGSALRRQPERFPAIVVFPQARRETNWQDASARMALAALDHTLEEFRTDPSRVYLTGLSMGGNGSWYLAYYHGRRFAAALVICGFVAPRGPFPGILPADTADSYQKIADAIKHLPVLIVHGEIDPVVPVSESRRMHAALSAAGAQVRYVELPGVNHNAWDATYGSPGLIEWLFKQQRSDTPPRDAGR